MVFSGRAIRRKTVGLAASVSTRVRAKLKPAKRRRLAHRLERTGHAATKVRAIATGAGGASVADRVKVKLED